MESEPVSEQIEWDSRRIASAFGLIAWKPEAEMDSGEYIDFEVRVKDLYLSWCFHVVQTQLQVLYLGEMRDEKDYCGIRHLKTTGWTYEANKNYDHLMAHILYRLGFEDVGVLSQLPTLSAHEKLELRLSMPREFWPQRWLDEVE